MKHEEESYDIVVCGGGLAGLCAAIAAARLGAKTCIIQDRPVFGGELFGSGRASSVPGNPCVQGAALVRREGQAGGPVNRLERTMGLDFGFRSGRHCRWNRERRRRNGGGLPAHQLEQLVGELLLLLQELLENGTGRTARCCR